MAIPRSCIRTSTLLTLLIALAVASGQAASATCEPHTIPVSKAWAEPLTRTVTLRAGEISLKDALARVADAAHLRLSYSADLLPLERKVCAAIETSAAGDVLNSLLTGVAVEPVVAGADYVVLTPVTAHALSSDDPAPEAIFPLRPVIATATSLDEFLKPTGYAATRIDGNQVTVQPSIADAINAHVPGMWAWQSPSGFTSLFSARGASSFGINSPKVYIDGIEVANPLLAAQIAPEDVQRIDVIRGPEGAVLYGADAMSGVTNIVTKHDFTGSGTPHLRVRTGLALSGSDYMGGPSVGQDHSVGVQFGSRARSGNFNFGGGSVGEYMPGAYARHLASDGSFRLVGTRVVLSGTGRVYAQSVGNPASMIVDPTLHNVSPLSMQQYTVGFKGIFRQNEKVTHSLVAGVDGYTLNGSPADSTRPLSAADSLLRAWDNGLRTTLRWTTIAQLAASAKTNAALTLTAEHSGLHQRGSGDAIAYSGELAAVMRHPDGELEHASSWADTSRSEYAGRANYEQSRSSNGLSAQLDGSLSDHLFLNAGLRLEHDVLAVAQNGTALLPMVGAAYVIGSPDGVSVKLRGAYGKAERWPEMPRLEWSYQRTSMARPVLAPEQQSGLEGGIDLSFHRVAGLQLTRYDQVASGLSQLVALKAQSPTTQQTQTNQPQHTYWPTYALQSVGEIANHGWELQAYLQRGALSLTGTMALTDSRVLRVANGYTGDLQPGDRMLGVPARTATLNAAWAASSWSASLSAARAFDWVNYDRAALASLATQPVGLELRNYWQQYHGFTHLRGTLTHSLPHGFTLLLMGDNLLGKQIGEPDNLTVIPGRTFSFGMRAAF